MSSTAGGVVGAIVRFGGYQLLKYGVGKSAAYGFAGLVVVVTVIIHFVYKRRLARFREAVDELPEEERRRFLQKVEPEIVEDLRRKDDERNGV